MARSKSGPSILSPFERRCPNLADPSTKARGCDANAPFLLGGSVEMARPKGFEPLTPRFVVWCSIQLSYGRAALPLAGDARAAT